MRIEICGAIGSGKTTLAKLLSDKGTKGVFENFIINPFWQAFYSNPQKYNFETEITFLLQHYHNIKLEAGNNDGFICDFSFYQDLAYAQMGLHTERLAIFQNILKECLNEINRPQLIIYLECDELTLIKRIKERGRNEEKEITLDFLQVLNSNIFSVINKMQNEINILTINSSQIDFANDCENQQYIIELINSQINLIKSNRLLSLD